MLSPLPDGCRVTSAVHGNVCGFHVYGELDVLAASHVRTVLSGAVGDASVLIDLCGVAFADGDGLDAVLEMIVHMVDAGGRVAVAVTSPGIAQLLRTGGHGRQVVVVDTTIAALGWLGGAHETTPRVALAPEVGPFE